MTEIKPCPCCGGKGEHWFCSGNGLHRSKISQRLCGENLEYHVIICDKCGLRTKVYATVKGCFNSWNRRVADDS